MRFAVPLALLFFVGCEPPVDPVTPPELRILSTDSTGELVSLRDGDRIELDLLVSGCFWRRPLRIQNVGQSSAHLRVSTTSPLVEVVTAPESLAPAEDALIELLFSPLEASRPFEGILTVEIDGQNPIHFELFGLVVTEDWEGSRRIDFGGVEVGSTETYAEIKITGIAGDFSQELDEPLRFSPRSLGPQRVEAKRTAYLHCPDIAPVTLLGDGVVSAITGPAEVDFGDVAVGSSAERDFVMTNYSRFFLTTQVNAPFTVVSDISPDVASRGGNFELVPATPTLRVRFSPNAMGPVNQDLIVSAGMKTLVIPVRGNGVP